MKNQKKLWLGEPKSRADDPSRTYQAEPELSRAESYRTHVNCGYNTDARTTQKVNSWGHMGTYSEERPEVKATCVTDDTTGNHGDESSTRLKNTNLQTSTRLLSILVCFLASHTFTAKSQTTHVSNKTIASLARLLVSLTWLSCVV